MTDLIRPALYNAIHPVYFHFNDERKENKQLVNVVGPICESGDVLIKNLIVDYDIKEGDTIVVENTGAYGYSMSHNFNTRPRAAEILIDKDSTQLIRKRETINDIFALCNV